MAEGQKGLLVRPVAPEGLGTHPDATLLEPRRVLLDTNILLVYLDARRAEHTLVRELVHAALGAGMALAADHTFHAVAGHAGTVMGDGAVAADQAVEQSGLAHVGASHQNDAG